MCAMALELLTLLMLNKFRWHAHFKSSANQITWSRLLIQIHILNDKQCRSRSINFFRSKLIWIYTVCKSRTYPGSAGQGLKQSVFVLCFFLLLNSTCDNSYVGLMTIKHKLHSKTTFAHSFWNSIVPITVSWPLTITTLWANSADDKLMIFFLFFPENRLWHFMQIISIGDCLHEMSKLVFSEKKQQKKKHFNML